VRANLSVICTVIVVASVSSCDKVVYIDDELRAQQRFGAVAIGESEESLGEVLGAPAATAIRTDSGLILEDRTDGAPRTLALRNDDRDQWPELIRFLPRRPIAQKVVVFIEGTVTAYYFIGADGRVEYVSVFTT
jgi:hypothetical protein